MVLLFVIWNFCDFFTLSTVENERIEESWLYNKGLVLCLGNHFRCFVVLLSLAKWGCSQYYSSDYFALIFRTRLLPVSEIKSSSFSKFENESDITNIWGFARQMTSYFPRETSCLMRALVSSSLKRYDFPYPLKTLA